MTGDPTCDDWDSAEQTAEILSDPDEVAAIREGLEDITAGRAHSLEEVAAEMRERGRLPDLPKAEYGAEVEFDPPRLSEPIEQDRIADSARTDAEADDLVEVLRARLAEPGESRDFDEFISEMGLKIGEDGTVAEKDGPHCFTLREGSHLTGMYAGTPEGKAAADLDCATLNARAVADRRKRSIEPLYTVVRSTLRTRAQFDTDGTRGLQ